MTLAVCQLNLPSRTVSGRRNYRRTKQHRRKYFHRPRVYLLSAGWFRFHIVSMRFGNQTITTSDARPNWHYYEFTLIFSRASSSESRITRCLFRRGFTATWLEEEELQPLFMYTVQFIKLYCGQEYPTCC